MKSTTMFPGVRMEWLAVVAAVFCLSLAGGVSAEEKDRPCAADAEKLCQGVQQGGGRVAKCLKEHESELSPACKENIGKMKAKMQDLEQACKEDATSLCKDVKRGGGRILQCLKQHESELSASCKEAMGQSGGGKQ